MHKIEQDCLIDFFKVVNEKFEYVVMRNAEELPFDNFSNDVDILIKETHFDNFVLEMNNVFFRNGFERVERTSFHGIECFTFYNIQNKTPYSLKIDLFFNFEGGGVRYFNFEDVIKFKIKNTNGIFVFNTKIESYLTALKTIAAGGKLKDKYLKSFIENNEDFNNELVENCPSSTLVAYMKSILKNKENPRTISRGKIVSETFLSNFKRHPIKSISRIIYHYKTEISRSFKKQYMIVLVGPDGSGKTTLIDKIKKDSNLVFRSNSNRFKVFHHRPHVLPNISQIFKKELNQKEEYNLNFNPHSDRQSNSIISFFKILYYTTDYFLGYFIKQISLQRENKFIIYDRYYYDFIVDQKRSALYVNRNLAIWLYNLFIPKPNKIFFIKVDAQSAHDRKKELPVNIIDEINSKYDRLTLKFQNFKIVPNIDLEKAYSTFRHNFIIVITKKVKI
jgi:hypothetical protein